jgi:hypothetical protein
MPVQTVKMSTGISDILNIVIPLASSGEKKEIKKIK